MTTENLTPDHLDNLSAEDAAEFRELRSNLGKGGLPAASAAKMYALYFQSRGLDPKAANDHAASYVASRCVGNPREGAPGYEKHLAMVQAVDQTGGWDALGRL
jgi:hypothetical protein